MQKFRIGKILINGNCRILRKPVHHCLPTRQYHTFSYDANSRDAGFILTAMELKSPHLAHRRKNDALTLQLLTKRVKVLLSKLTSFNRELRQLTNLGFIGQREINFVSVQLHESNR